MVFCISVILVGVSPLSFFILFIWLLSLLLGKPGQRSIFVYLFRKSDLGIIDFLKISFIYFLSDFYYFLPSIDFRFCVSFLKDIFARLRMAIFSFSHFEDVTPLSPGIQCLCWEVSCQPVAPLEVVFLLFFPLTASKIFLVFLEFNCVGSKCAFFFLSFFLSFF